MYSHVLHFRNYTYLCVCVRSVLHRLPTLPPLTTSLTNRIFQFSMYSMDRP